MQERDEHAPVWPDMWCFPGGGLEDGEEPVAGAVRELAEETGVVVAPEDLTDLGQLRAGHASAAPSTSTPSSRVRRSATATWSATRAGRWSSSTPTRCPTSTSCRRRRSWRRSSPAWIEEHPFVPAADQHRFAGVILVDRQGPDPAAGARRAPAASTRRSGAWPAATSIPGEDFEAAAYRELEEETGVRLAPGALDALRRVRRRPPRGLRHLGPDAGLRRRHRPDRRRHRLPRGPSDRLRRPRGRPRPRPDGRCRPTSCPPSSTHRPTPSCTRQERA